MKLGGMSLKWWVALILFMGALKALVAMVGFEDFVVIVLSLFMWNYFFGVRKP